MVSAGTVVTSSCPDRDDKATSRPSANPSGSRCMLPDGLSTSCHTAVTAAMALVTGS